MKVLTAFIIATGAAANPLSGLQFIVDLVVAAVQVAGIVFALKGLSDFIPSLQSRDGSGIVQGLLIIAGGLAMFLVRTICAGMGISLTI